MAVRMPQDYRAGPCRIKRSMQEERLLLARQLPGHADQVPFQEVRQLFGAGHRIADVEIVLLLGRLLDEMKDEEVRQPSERIELIEDRHEGIRKIRIEKRP